LGIRLDCTSFHVRAHRTRCEKVEERL
jgi:hypothetical protein